MEDLQVPLYTSIKRKYVFKINLTRNMNEVFTILKPLTTLRLKVAILKYCFCISTKKRDIRSNIPLCLKEFPRAKPEGTPEGKKKVYLTVHPDSSPHNEEFNINIQLFRMIWLIIQQIKVPSSRACCKALPNLQHAFSIKCPSSRRRLGRALIPLPLDGHYCKPCC